MCVCVWVCVCVCVFSSAEILILKLIKFCVKYLVQSV
jgi:hypothetical protein